MLNEQTIEIVILNLTKLSAVSKLDKVGEPQAATIAHAIMDIMDSMLSLRDKYIPALLNPSASEEELYDVLIEIGEEFRHIQYHIKDPEFFSYLKD